MIKNISKKVRSFIYKKLLLIHLLFFVLIAFAFIKVLNKNSYITVSGFSYVDLDNEIATFTVSPESLNADKQTAVQEVSSTADKIVSDLKELGIPDKDIKTTGLNIYQREDYKPNGTYEPGDWYASYNIQITLRDLNKSPELTSLLSSYEKASMWGPDLSYDRKNIDEESLLRDAIEDAKSKASVMALKSNRRLGRILAVSEGYTYQDPIMYKGYDMAVTGMGESAGFPIEPGTSETSKSVTVTFRLW